MRWGWLGFARADATPEGPTFRRQADRAAVVLAAVASMVRQTSARWDTVAVLGGLSNLAVGLESAALAGALAFGVWARRSRDASSRRVAGLEAQLEEQRSAGERREGVLRTVVETIPVAMVLFGDAGNIIFTNRSARDLFFEGKAIEGRNFLSMIERAPLSLRQLGDAPRPSRLLRPRSDSAGAQQPHQERA